MYFSATIFALVGFRSPTLTSLSIAVTNFLFTLVAFHYIDRIGRRRILLWSVPIMVIGLVLCSVAFNFLDLPTEKAAASDISIRATSEDKTWPMIILIAMVTYVAGYAIGMGNVPWQQSEYVSSPFLVPTPYQTICKLTYIQTLPALCPQSWLRARHSNKLGLQLPNRHLVSPYDGVSDPDGYIRIICWNLRSVLGYSL